jgi:hypothetical protein
MDTTSSVVNFRLVRTPTRVSRQHHSRAIYRQTRQRRDTYLRRAIRFP